jgi:hypothetical protein
MVPSYAAGMSLTDAGRSSRAVEEVLVYRDTLPITGQQSRSVLQPHNVGVDQRASAELLGQLGYAEREQPTRPAGRLSTVQLSIKCSQSQNSRMLEIQRMVSYFFFLGGAQARPAHDQICNAAGMHGEVQWQPPPWWGEGGNDELRQESCLGRKRRSPRQ